MHIFIHILKKAAPLGEASLTYISLKASASENQDVFKAKAIEVNFPIDNFPIERYK